MPWKLDIFKGKFNNTNSELNLVVISKIIENHESSQSETETFLKSIEKSK